MTALKILLCILFVLFLIGRIRTGGEVEYSQEGLKIWVKLGTVKFSVFPLKAKQKTKKKKQKESQEKPKESASPKEEKRGGALALVRELLPLVGEAAGKMKRKLRIDLLVLRLTWAAQDPATAAMGYGAAYAAMGMLYPVLDHNFNIKAEEVGIEVDYEPGQPRVYLDAALTMTIGEIFVFALYFGIRFLGVFMKQRKTLPRAKKKEAVTDE